MRWGEGRRWETGSQGAAIRRSARETYIAHRESEATAETLENNFRLIDRQEARELLWAAWAEIENSTTASYHGETT